MAFVSFCAFDQLKQPVYPLQWCRSCLSCMWLLSLLLLFLCFPQLGTSPLHLAAQHGHYSTADVLLRAGVSRDARTKVDRTPLHMAAAEGHTVIVELLIRVGLQGWLVTVCFSRPTFLYLNDITRGRGRFKEQKIVGPNCVFFYS